MKRNWNEGLWVVCQHVDLTLLYESRYDSPLLDLQTPWPLHASADSFNDTLCDHSPVLDLRTLTPDTPEGTSNDTLCDSPPATNPQKSANAHLK